MTTAPIRPLTPRQQDFVREYLIDLNGKEAAIRAGYSARSAKDIAKDNLANPAIQQAIALVRDKQIERTHVTADRVVLELARIAFADPRKIVDGKGKPIPLQDLDANTAAAIVSVDMYVHPTAGIHSVKYRFAPKAPALEMLAKHTGILADKPAGVDNDRGSVSLKDALVYYREMLVMRGGEGRVIDGAIVDTTRSLDG